MAKTNCGQCDEIIELSQVSRDCETHGRIAGAIGQAHDFMRFKNQGIDQDPEEMKFYILGESYPDDRMYVFGAEGVRRMVRWSEHHHRFVVEEV